MSVSIRLILGICVGALVLMMSASPATALTIHPAVLKNFVGPFRKPGEPILRSTFYDRPQMLNEKMMDRVGQGSNALQRPHNFDAHYPRQHMRDSDMEATARGQEAIYPPAVKGPAALQQEWSRPLRSCKGNGGCAQNMDSTLNLLMRMMETGKR